MAVDPILNQALLPFRKRALFLRLVSSKSRAADYAAGGFHVSVARGLAGGCQDASHDFLAGGTKDGQCAVPLKREDAQAAWAAAARLYNEAFQMALGSAELGDTLAKLRAANAAADAAYRLEGVTPPADPVVAAQGQHVPEPVGKMRSGAWPLAAAGGLVVAGLVITALVDMHSSPRHVGPHGTHIVR